MKTGTGLLLGIVGATVIGGYSYRSGVDKLQFSVAGIIPGAQQIGIKINVFNPSGLWRYPVPQLVVNVISDEGIYLGTLYNNQLQWIRANGYSTLTAWVIPEYASLINLLAALVIPGASGSNKFHLHGAIIVAGYQIAFSQDVELSAALSS